MKPANGLDDRMNEVLVDRACGDEGAEVDRPRGKGEQSLPVDVRGELAARDCRLEHRIELGHAAVEKGPREIPICGRKDSE